MITCLSTTYFTSATQLHKKLLGYFPKSLKPQMDNITSNLEWETSFSELEYPEISWRARCSHL